MLNYWTMKSQVSLEDVHLADGTNGADLKSHSMNLLYDTKCEAEKLSAAGLTGAVVRSNPTRRSLP